MKNNETVVDFDAILNEARQAAQHSMETTEVTTWWPCGFAWIVLRPATGKFVKYLRAQDRPPGVSGRMGDLVK